MSENYTNFADYRPFLRGLLLALDAWVTKDKAPPPSVYPRLSDRTLVAWTQQATGFPTIPGIRFPKTIQQPSLNDFGPDFASKRIITIEPPKVGSDYVVIVPKNDADGNDLGMLLPPEVAVPLGTYTGWNLRRKEVGAEEAMANLQGSFIPFPTGKSDDPRPSIAKRYADVKEYRDFLNEACARLVRERYMAAEDQPRYQAYGTALWKNVTGK
jgi:hypothetical protein